MKPYLLLTPGPLTTSTTVKEAMMTDWCTWDEDYNLGIVEELRKELVSLATAETEDYTSILLQGSGTYCVEAVPVSYTHLGVNSAFGTSLPSIVKNSLTSVLSDCFTSTIRLAIGL